MGRRTSARGGRAPKLLRDTGSTSIQAQVGGLKRERRVRGEFAGPSGPVFAGRDRLICDRLWGEGQPMTVQTCQVLQRASGSAAGTKRKRSEDWIIDEVGLKEGMALGRRRRCRSPTVFGTSSTPSGGPDGGSAAPLEQASVRILRRAWGPRRLIAILYDAADPFNCSQVHWADKYNRSRSIECS